MAYTHEKRSSILLNQKRVISLMMTIAELNSSESLWDEYVKDL
jgi:hypothetical protein